MKYFKNVVLILFLTVGFSCEYLVYKDSGLNTSKGIYYDNIAYTDNVTFNNVDGTNLDYSASLTTLGEYYEVYFDVVNSTKYDIEIADYVYNKDDQYIECNLTYDDDTKIKNGDIIKSGEVKRIKYKAYYKNVIEEDNYTFDSSFNIFYEQVV